MHVYWLGGKNPPDIFLVFKAHRKVTDGLNLVSCWQGSKFFDQVLLLCHTQKRQDKPSLLSFAQVTIQNADVPLHIVNIHRLLPFSSSFLMTSSEKTGSSPGNMPLLLTEIPLHLIVIFPGWTNQKRWMCCYFCALGVNVADLMCEGEADGK